MVVIARLPALDAAPSAARTVAPAGAPTPVEPTASRPERPQRRGRRAGPRFPTLSTLILAAAAGACWAAVWWQERTQMVVSADDGAEPDLVTADVGSSDREAGSVTR